MACASRMTAAVSWSMECLRYARRRIFRSVQLLAHDHIVKYFSWFALDLMLREAHLRAGIT